MAYEDQEQKRSRVVVDTPTSRREYTSSESSRVPDRSGMSGGTVAAIVVGIVALVTIFFLVIYNRQTTDEVNANAQMASATASPQQPIIVQQPATAPQQPVIVQQPAQPATQPIIVQAPTPLPAQASNTGDDATVLTALNKKFEEDAVLSGLALNADVLNGKVLLTGTVTSNEQKTRAEQIARTVKGVKYVDNQIIVSSS
ncbi:MAG: hyperosmotically inducible periplasmic protein [Blastocatellia bacterium]|nr:hyperosmotically inducible periplasmic protein [Blastocatellia bacterium]